MSRTKPDEDLIEAPQRGTHVTFVRRRAVDLDAALAPLIEHLSAYDAARTKLETEGGQVEDLGAITRRLRQPLRLRGAYTDHSVSLTDPEALRAAVRDIGDYDVQIDVRQLDSHLPVYYLCRTRRDYWAEYSLVVEDFYRSPRYPMLDERFVRLMYFGHETYYLRLSPFRGQTAALMGEEAAAGARTVDEMLYTVGRHVFQAAWHEDQRVGILTAQHFRLPRFREAIELLYLCLSGELCELRSAVDEPMLRFFEAVYPQAAVRGFLQRLTTLDGGALSELPQQARQGFAQLSAAFRQFIQVEVPWGARRVSVPLYKLIFGNLSRLELVSRAFQGHPKVNAAANRLEDQAQYVMDALVPPGRRERKRRRQRGGRGTAEERR